MLTVKPFFSSLSPLSETSNSVEWGHVTIMTLHQVPASWFWNPWRRRQDQDPRVLRLIQDRNSVRGLNSSLEIKMSREYHNTGPRVVLQRELMHALEFNLLILDEGYQFWLLIHLIFAGSWTRLIYHLFYYLIRNTTELWPGLSHVQTICMRSSHSSCKWPKGGPLVHEPIHHLHRSIQTQVGREETDKGWEDGLLIAGKLGP